MCMKAVIAILIALLLSGSGCAAPTMVAAGASLTALEFGVTAWRKGLLSTAELGTLDEAHAAVFQTLTELQFGELHEMHAENGRWCQWTATDGQGRNIKIRCSRISPVMTKLKIRVGFIPGDEAVSLALHQQINERLRSVRQQRAGPPDAADPAPVEAAP
jgi:hypothetical protein